MYSLFTLRKPCFPSLINGQQGFLVSEQTMHGQITEIIQALISCEDDDDDEGQTDRQTDRQMDRQTGRQAVRQTDTNTDRQKYN